MGFFSTWWTTLSARSRIFGFHFATLDLRQESSVHTTSPRGRQRKRKRISGKLRFPFGKEKIKVLTRLKPLVGNPFSNELVNDTLASIRAAKTIQEKNGALGCNRYIISQCNSALNMMEVYGLFLLGGWKKETGHRYHPAI